MILICCIRVFKSIYDDHDGSRIGPDTTEGGTETMVLWLDQSPVVIERRRCCSSLFTGAGSALSNLQRENGVLEGRAVSGNAGCCRFRWCWSSSLEEAGSSTRSRLFSKPLLWPRRFRFHQAFRSFKHGRPAEVEKLRAEFLQLLNELAPSKGLSE